MVWGKQVVGRELRKIMQKPGKWFYWCQGPGISRTRQIPLFWSPFCNVRKILYYYC